MFPAARPSMPWFLTWVLPLFVALSSLSVRGESEVHLVPHIWVDRFDHGEVNGWETYPFFQDMGFNPTLFCVTEPAREGTHSLSQNFIPTDTDFPTDQNRIGLVKRGFIQTAPDSRIRCSIFLSSDRRAEKVEVILCTVQGEKYTASLPSPPANEWVDMNLGLTEFENSGAPLRGGETVEAVVILATLGTVTPDRGYTLHLDAFEFSGLRPNRFVAADPESTWLEHYRRTILHRHYRPGETVSLSVRPLAPEEGDKALASAACSVIDGRGEVRVEGVEMRADEDGVWANDAIYTLADNDPPGRWRLRVRGVTKSGTAFENDLEFLSPTARMSSDARPRLFFGPEDVKRRAEERRDPNLDRTFQKAVHTARHRIEDAVLDDYIEFREVNDEYLGGSEFSPHWDEYMRWRKALDASVPAKEGAFLYALDGDDSAGAKAKELLLHVCSFSAWSHPWMDARATHMYYPVGYTAYRIGAAYDLIHPLFTPEERGRVRKALVDFSIRPTFHGEVVDDHIPSNISNHLGVSCGGALMAALSLYGEDPNNPYLEPQLSGILIKFEAHLNAGYLPDRTYGEPFVYHHMDADMSVKTVAALERAFGIDLTSTTNLKDAWHYAVYVSNTDGKDCLDMGDGAGVWGANSKIGLLWPAHRLDDPLAWDRYLWATGPEIHSEFPLDFYDYLWRPLDLHSTPIDHLPTSRWFWAKGYAAFRSGWHDDDFMFLYKAGPHSNHYHLDQGNFLLRYGGEVLLDEGGYAKYYENKYYHPFYTQAVGHNTLLLGNYPESQDLADLYNDVAALDSHPRIIQCSTGEIFDALESELASVYKNRLDSYRRSILFPKGDYLILYDEVEAKRPETFNWLFHTYGKESIVLTGASARIVRPKADLRMEILEPASFDPTVRMHPHGDKSFLTLSTTEKDVNGRLLAVLIPSKEEDRFERNKWMTTSVEAPGWVGVRVDRGGEVDHAFFRTEGEGLATAAGFRTDAHRFFITTSEDGALRRFWMADGSTFETLPNNGGHPARITADSPSTFALRLEEGVLDLESHFDSPETVTVDLGADPKSIRVNGTEVDETPSAGAKRVMLRFGESR